MKNPTPVCPGLRYLSAFALTLLLLFSSLASSKAATPTVLFQDDFNSGFPGWVAVQPAGGAYNGTMLWEYDGTSNSFSEQSNIFTDSSAFSPTRIAVMLINNTVAPASFTYSARLTGGDDDGWGLVFGYQNERTFYRVEFARQNDVNRNANWPFYGWDVDRMNDGAITDLFGGVGSSGTFVHAPGVPFDVTITVTNDAGNNRLTLTITNDPLNAATVIPLVADQPIPVSAAGQVGIFSWGMQGLVSGIRSFRVQNPTLSPTPISGSAPLTNWSFLVTPKTNSPNPPLTAGGPTNGFWGLGLGVTGPKGILIESSDYTADNGPLAVTNFATPTAIAGDSTWSNYVYSARFINSDDDGFGLVLRYQNETNFYRVAFRQQNSTSGIKRGVSVQKNINRNFDQLFASTSAGWLPPIDGVTTYDVYACIRTNTLQVIGISNLNGATIAMAASGPMDMSGSTVSGTLDTGKIGLFSWAMANFQCDSVKVQSISGEGLQVASAFGNPDPPLGLNDIPIGTLVTAKVEQVVFTQPGVRKSLTGFSGAGSAPASGTTNQITFSLNSFSSLVWRWRSDYLVTVSATPGGTAGFLGSQYLSEGTNITVIATNNPGYIFLGWSGSSDSQTTNLNFTVTTPITLLARFAADSDGDGLPDEWELAWFGNLAQGPNGDPDGDGRNNLLEYQLGTNPTFAEPPIFSDGLTSRWINDTRDRAIPGWFVVTNFGDGFRGVWEASNYNEGAGTPGTSLANSNANVSFQGPLIAVRSNAWDDAWSRTNSMQVEYSVGDDDGVCLYWRYNNVSNYYRLTIDDQTQTTVSPLQGVTVQMRVNGVFSLVTPTVSGSFPFSDPFDNAGFKRFRVTINSTNDTFEIHVAGWDRFLSPPDWNTNAEKILTFQDASLPTGRIAIGDWGMSAGPGGVAWNATVDNPPTSVFNPIGAGVLIDNIIVSVDGTPVFTEDWETATLHTDFPVGWTNPYPSPGPASIGGDWHITAHGTVGNLNNNFGSFHSGTAVVPRQDGEGPMMLVTPTTNGNYLLEVGITPWDDGGMGFVYDFQDTNNFARVLFDAQVPAATGELLQGLNVGRKSGGVWKDILVGDKSFIYTPGRPFDVRFANNNGVYTMVAWNSDTPGTTYRWQWSDQSAALTNRFGYAVWNMPDGHYNYLRASALNNLTATPFRITSITTSGPNLTLGVSKPLYSLYTVQRASAVGGPYLPVALNQNGVTYSEPLPNAPAFYRLLLQQ